METETKPSGDTGQPTIRQIIAVGRIIMLGRVDGASYAVAYSSQIEVFGNIYDANKRLWELVRALEPDILELVGRACIGAEEVNNEPWRNSPKRSMVH